MRIKRRGMGFRTPYIHKHTRASWQIMGMKADIDHILPPPPPPKKKKIKSCPTSILPSDSETPGPLPLTQCNYFNLTVCKWMLAFFLNKRVVQDEELLRNVLTPQRLEVLCSPRPPSKMLYANVNFSKWLT